MWCNADSAKPIQIPNLPKPPDIFAAFTGADMYGPSKITLRIYHTAEDIASALAKAKYLGRNLEVSDAQWRSGENFFHQSWHITLKDKSGLSIRVFEQMAGSEKKRYCYLTYFDSKTNTRGGMRYSYYYQLPTKMENKSQ